MAPYFAPKRIRNLIVTTFVLLSMTACDAPRTQRRVGNSLSSSDIFGTPVIPSTNSGTGSDTGGETESSSITIPSEVSHCNWSQDGETGFERTATHLSPSESSASAGAYTLCKSTLNSNDIYIQMKSPLTSEQLCLVPTTHSGSNSTYIGEPRCLYIRDNKTVYKITMIKNRAGYSNYTMTGIMLMKDKAYTYGAPFNQVILSPDAYIFCSQWLAQYGDPSYCIPFREAGHYVYHQF